MAEELMVITKGDLEENPTIIGESIVQLAQAIVDTKGNIQEIKDRGFWKRLVNNNTRDLAEAMIKQNDTISGFLTIVQGVIFLSMNNVVVLGGIMDALNKQEDTNNLRDNQYYKMAKDYLSEAIKSAQKVAANEAEIENVKIRLIEHYKIQESQNKLLDDLRQELKKNAVSDQQQDNIIKSIKIKMNEKSIIDEKQNYLLSQIQEELNRQELENKRLVEILNKVHRNIEDMMRLDEVHNRQIEELTFENNRQYNMIGSISKINEEQGQQIKTLREMYNTQNLHIQELDMDNTSQNEMIKNLTDEQKKTLENFELVNNLHNSKLDDIEKEKSYLTKRVEELEISRLKLQKILYGMSGVSIISLIIGIIHFIIK